MGQISCPSSLSISQGQWCIIRALLQGVVVWLVVVWVAPLVSISVPGGVFQRDSILTATAWLTRIPEALGRVQEERSRTGAEREALGAFATRLETMATDTQPSPKQPGRGRLGLSEDSSQSGVAMERVRDAYRETVMATEHYQEDYGESLGANVTGEFGPDLATAIVHGETLTPQLQQTLIAASHTAVNERNSYLQTLTTEHKSLQTAKRHLHTHSETLDRLRDHLKTPEPFSALIETHAHLENLTADCTRLLEDRQATLTNQPHDDHHHHLTEYLYRDYPWTYPVLADTLDCHTKLQILKQKALQSIARHP